MSSLGVVNSFYMQSKYHPRNLPPIVAITDVRTTTTNYSLLLAPNLNHLLAPLKVFFLLLLLLLLIIRNIEL